MRQSRDAPAAPAVGLAPYDGAQRVKTREHVSMRGRARDAVRADLEEVFRRDYRTTVPAGEARGWLSVAAAHTALNAIRSARRRAEHESAAAAQDQPVVLADVAESVVTSEERAHVRSALARLPRKQAVALVLRHSGLSYGDVAAALDMSPGSVGTTVRRAESALREELIRHASSR